MHILRALHGDRARRSLPELRRRVAAATATSRRKAGGCAGVHAPRVTPGGLRSRHVSEDAAPHAKQRQRGASPRGTDAPRLAGLPPIENPRARVLILGSMPGAASLAAGQYYSHPRNLFWPLLGAILGFDPDSDYALRVAALKHADIALWDVIGHCHRSGSLDARIDPKSVVANDFAAFLARHPRLHTVCFNGATAEASWRRHVLPALATPGLRTLRLPSTSPANASIARERKLAAWAAALESGAAPS